MTLGRVWWGICVDMSIQIVPSNTYYGHKVTTHPMFNFVRTLSANIWPFSRENKLKIEITENKSGKIELGCDLMVFEMLQFTSKNLYL